MADVPVSQGALLAAHELVVGHGEVPVCGPVTFDLPAGHAVAVVGANGAGKSTLLTTLAGLLPRSRGNGAGRCDVRPARPAGSRRELIGPLGPALRLTP